jgi:hypothetical protein
METISAVIEAPCSKLRGMFCLAAVLRSDRKEVCHFQIRSLTPQQAAGNALAFAVQREAADEAIFLSKIL